MSQPPVGRHRGFQLLLSSNVTNQLGFRVSQIVLPLLAISMLAAGPFEVGLLHAAQAVGVLLLGLPAGALVDRTRRRRLMVAMDLLRAGLMGTLPVAAMAGLLTLPQLLIVAFVAGVAGVFFDVASQAHLPALVGRGQLLPANARLQAGQSVAVICGPALGGVLVAVVGAAHAFLVVCLSFLISALLLGQVREPDPVTASARPRRLLEEIAEGLRFVLCHGALRAIAVCTASTNLFMSMVVTLLVLFLTREVGLSPAVTGVVLAASGVGSVAAALTTRVWVAVCGPVRTIWLALLVTQPFGLLLWQVRPGWSLAWFVVAWFMVGYGGTLYNITQVSFRQLICPDELLGRVQAANRVLAWATLPVGGMLAGLVGEWLGVRQALLLAASGLVGSALWVVWSPLRRMGRGDLVGQPTAG